MKKRFFAVVCFCLFVVSLASCGKSNHEHVFGNRIVIKEHKKNKKGVSVQICSECGFTKAEEIPLDNTKHRWDAGVVTKNPTVEENGIKKYTCIVCEATKEEAIEKINHSFSIESKSEYVKVADSYSEAGSILAKDRAIFGLPYCTNSTPRWFLEGNTSAQQLIGIKAITEELGEHSNEEYYSYTCLIVNTSSEALTVKLHMIYSNVTNYVDKAVRAMTYEAKTETVHVYQLADNTPIKYEDYPAEPQNFSGQGIVYDEYVTIPGTVDPANPEYLKYSVFFWLEGQDYDCVEKIYNGTIKFTLTCSVE